VGVNTGYTCLCRFYTVQAKAVYNCAFIFSKFLHVKNRAYQRNIQKIIISIIFLTMRATHGIF